MVAAIGVALSAGLATPCAAQLAAQGDEFQVNTHTVDEQTGPSVCLRPGAAAVVVWQSDNQTGPAGLAGRDVFGQRYLGSGQPLGSEFQVNAFTTDQQDDSRVVCHDSGAFVVVWESAGQDGDGNGVFGRVFGSSGTPQTGEFRLNNHTTLDQADPAVAWAGDGTLLAVWESLGQDGNSLAIVGRRFTSAGTPIGTEFAVNAYTTGAQRDPRVVRASAGGFIVAWEGDSTAGGADRDVFFRSFDASGQPSSGDVRINTTTENDQGNPALAALPEGGFVVVWQSIDQDGSNEGIIGQRFGPAATRIGPQFQVNVFTTGPQDDPAIAAGADGAFVVVWESSYQDASDNGVFGRLFDPAGTPVGEEFAANQTTLASQADAAVAMRDGLATIAWRDASGHDGDRDGIFARRFARVDTTTLPPTPTTTLATTTTSLTQNEHCGDYDGTGSITAVDALGILRTAVGLSQCPACFCDVDGSATVTASDALRTLRVAVGVPLALDCPRCA